MEGVKTFKRVKADSEPQHLLRYGLGTHIIIIKPQHQGRRNFEYRLKGGEQGTAESNIIFDIIPSETKDADRSIISVTARSQGRYFAQVPRIDVEAAEAAGIPNEDVAILH